MTRYVALLRGIAPMRPNMRNAELRRVAAELGLRDVRSVVSSGNLVFTSASEDVRGLEVMLEEAWPGRLGFTSTSIVRSRAELLDLVAADPFPGLEHSRRTTLYVTFLQAGGSRRPPDVDGYRVVLMRPREICAVIDETDARAGRWLAAAERVHGKAATGRSWLTVRRILAAME